MTQELPMVCDRIRGMTTAAESGCCLFVQDCSDYDLHYLGTVMASEDTYMFLEHISADLI